MSKQSHFDDRTNVLMIELIRSFKVKDQSNKILHINNGLNL